MRAQDDEDWMDTAWRGGVILWCIAFSPILLPVLGICWCVGKIAEFGRKS